MIYDATNTFSVTVYFDAIRLVSVGLLISLISFWLWQAWC